MRSIEQAGGLYAQGSGPARQRALARGATAVAFACGLALPFNMILHSAGGQDFRLLDLLCIALAPLALWACLRRARLLLALILLGLLFVLPSLVHGVVLLDQQGDYRDFVFPVRFLLALPFCAALTSLLDDARHRTWFAVGLCLGCAANVAPLVFQSLGQHDLMVALGLAPAELVIPDWEVQQRPPGLHAHANATSAVISLGIPMAAFMAVHHRRLWLLPFSIATLLACSYYTETRSAVVISLATMSLALALRWRSDKVLLLLPAFALTGLIVAGWSEGPLLPKSFARLDTAANNLAERLTTMLTGLRLTFEHPLGLGRTLGELSIYDLSGVRAIHNGFVWLGISLGLAPAVFALIALLGSTVRVARPGAAGLRGLFAFHLLGLCMFEDHFQNQTFIVLLILLVGGWLVEQLRGFEERATGFRRAPVAHGAGMVGVGPSPLAREERA